MARRTTSRARWGVGLLVTAGVQGVRALTTATTVSSGSDPSCVTTEVCDGGTPVKACCKSGSVERAGTSMPRRR